MMTISGSNRHEILLIVLRSSVCKALTVPQQRRVSCAYSRAWRSVIALSKVGIKHGTGSIPHTGSANERPLWVKCRHSAMYDGRPLYLRKADIALITNGLTSGSA